MEIWVINLSIRTLLDLIKNEASSLPGTYERRLPTEAMLPVYLGVEIPSNLYKFSFLFNKDFEELLADDGTEGFSISITADTSHPGSSKFCISLLHTKYSEIFLILCSDLLNILSTKEQNGKSTLIKLNKRLDYWRQFLKRSRIDRLSTEAEIGLIGELLLLKILLTRNPNLDLINHWRGPLGSTHDFVGNDVSIEVKTTTVKQKRFVKISSEFQLDIENSQKLFIAHIEINESIKSSNSFNLISLVFEIKKIISLELHPVFNGLLACVGLKEADAHFYEKKQFALVEMQFYSVTEGFPRLISKDLSPNISDTQYRLNLAGLDSFKTNTEDVFDILLG